MANSRLVGSAAPRARIRAALAGATLALALTAAACGGSGSSSSPSSSAATTAPSPAAAADRATAAATGAGAQAQAAPPAAGAAQSSSVARQTKLNLNTATREQFLTVPGVGDRFVREFMEYRPYTTIAQFRRELGKYVSQDQVREWEKYVFVPVDPNKADAETLQQLPGVSAEVAGQLVAARPYASTDAFVTKLGQLTSADQAGAARPYLVAS